MEILNFFFFFNLDAFSSFKLCVISLRYFLTIMVSLISKGNVKNQFFMISFLYVYGLSCVILYSIFIRLIFYYLFLFNVFIYYSLNHIFKCNFHAFFFVVIYLSNIHQYGQRT